MYTEQGSPVDTQNEDEFWELLIAHIEEDNVVPVIGPDLLTVNRNGKPVSFYRIVAEELLAKFDVPLSKQQTLASNMPPSDSTPVVLRHGFELMDAVCTISKLKNKHLDEFYTSINSIVKKQLASFAENLPESLIKLAEIKPLSLFVTTTCDSLLATALNYVYPRDSNVYEVEYAPNLSSDKLRDLPEDFQSQADKAVFYLFGKVSAAQSHAIHEEDMLEWTYNLQSDLEAGPDRLLNIIRDKHLLFIGCPFNDWLGRYLIRTSNNKRLLDNRGKFEFLVMDPKSADPNLRLFLERYSRNSKLYFKTANNFVEELSARWNEQHPRQTPRSSDDNQIGGDTSSKHAPSNLEPFKGAIFISYANEDSLAAQALYEELKNLAGDNDVAWLDKRGGLTIGDDWERDIKRTITKDCKLFMPLISSTTQRRLEGVFRKEWRWAVERDEGIFGKKFILPLIVDEQVAAISPNDLRVEPRFKELDIGKAIDGRLEDKLSRELVKIIREMRREY